MSFKGDILQLYNNGGKNKRAILFSKAFLAAGGAERLLFRESQYLDMCGFKTYILTLNFNETARFNDTYNQKVEQIGYKNTSNSTVLTILRLIGNVFAIRKRIREIKPDLILLTDVWDCILFYFATLFTPYSYSSHIHGTIFWFPDDLFKYGLIYRKVFGKIRESVIGHKEFIPARPPRVNLLKRLAYEIGAVVMNYAVRKAKKVFVLTNHMKWEVEQLHGKDAIVIKGAIDKEILNYKPKKNIKKCLGLENKTMILNVNRLDPRKRVDLLIKAFKQIYLKYPHVYLVIGGTGPEEKKLKDLSMQIGVTNRVKFVGYISEQELWDYFASCDVFVHPFWREHSIVAYEALAMNKKVVWSTEMEIDEYLQGNPHVFAANPEVDELAAAILKAINTKVTEKNDLSIYSYDNYFKILFGELIQPSEQLK